MSDTYEIAIIGMGPAGIGVATTIQCSSVINNTICFDRGLEIGSKNCIAINNEPCCESDSCHIISGIGGASNLSSGKISIFPAGSGLVQFFSDEQELKDVMSQVVKVLEDNAELKKIEIDTSTIAYVEDYYKSNNITYKYYDVYEFDGEKYRNYLSMIINELITKGLQIHTNAQIIAINRDEKMSCYIITANENGVTNYYSVKKVIFAVGSSQIDKCLLSNFSDASKTSYEIGARIEAKSECFGDSLNYHGDLKLKYNNGRTYCVTKDGAVVSYKTNGYCLLEGYIDSGQRTGYSNLAVLIKTTKKSELDEFLQNYQAFFGGVPIRQKYTDYLLEHASSDSVYTTLATSKLGDVNKIFPDSINQSLKEFIDHVVIDIMKVKKEELTIIAPEIKISRSIELSKQFEIKPNIYVVGAATGKFRGILQSFCSGIQCGKYILSR